MGRPLGKCLNCRKNGFISKFTANLAFFKLTENLALSPNLQLIWLFLCILSQFGSFSECTIKCLLPLQIDRQFSSFSECKDNLALSLNVQPIWLFLWIYSQFGSFSEFTAHSALSLNVLLSVYYTSIGEVSKDFKGLTWETVIGETDRSYIISYMGDSNSRDSRAMMASSCYYNTRLATVCL